jgi:riboflavin kinase/FMN adenylyltransferase
MAIHKVAWDDDFPPVLCGGAVAIGNFDGAHLGHAALIAEVLRHKGAGPGVAVTFDPHPLTLLRPGFTPQLLTTVAERCEQLHGLGVDHVVLLKSTRELFDLTADRFFAEVIQRRLAPRAMVEGENFRFGHNREGDIERLAQLCRASSIEFFVQPSIHAGEEPISSSRIRSLLVAGDVSGANRLLGRNYCLSGIVEQGARRGRTIGFPTANLGQVQTVIPKDGVYAVRVSLSEGVFAAAANVGGNPTFAESRRKIEIHLIGFNGDLYGREIKAEFVERLRDTRTFGGVDELISQLKHDIEAAKRIL